MSEPTPEQEIAARFEYLRENWDSYAGWPFQSGVEDRARKVLEILRNPRPSICMTVEGGIFLTWPDGDDHEAITISVQPNDGFEVAFGEVYLEVTDD